MGCARPFGTNAGAEASRRDFLETVGVLGSSENWNWAGVRGVRESSKVGRERAVCGVLGSFVSSIAEHKWREGSFNPGDHHMYLCRSVQLRHIERKAIHKPRLNQHH